MSLATMPNMTFPRPRGAAPYPEPVWNSIQPGLYETTLNGVPYAIVRATDRLSGPDAWVVGRRTKLAKFGGRPRLRYVAMAGSLYDAKQAAYHNANDLRAARDARGF